MVNRRELAEQSPVGNLAAAYQLALDQRAFEIAQLTNRNNFFMVFQGVLLAGLIQSQGAAAPVMNFFVCVAGMAMSLFQAGMASGAKYWQIRWEVAVKRIEMLLLKELEDAPQLVQLFTADMTHLSPTEQIEIRRINSLGARAHDKLNDTKGFIGKLVKADLTGPLPSLAKWAIKRRFSVSKIPFWVGVSLFLVWVLIWINTFSLLGKPVAAWLVEALPWRGDFFNFVAFVK